MHISLRNLYYFIFTFMPISSTLICTAMIYIIMGNTGLNFHNVSDINIIIYRTPIHPVQPFIFTSSNISQELSRYCNMWKIPP